MFGIKDLDYINAIIALIIGLIALYLFRFYSIVFSLPKGPIPLPIIGNILEFRAKKVNQLVTINELHKKYGSVITVWFGTTPAVIIADYEILKTIYNSPQNELMGRPDSILKDIILQGGSDIFMTDYGLKNRSLRKIAHVALNKILASGLFEGLVDNVVDEAVRIIIKNEGLDKAFDPAHYLNMTVLNIVTGSTFGKTYNMDDDELKLYDDGLQCFWANMSTIMLIDRLPIVRPFFYKVEEKMRTTLRQVKQNIGHKYLERLKVYQKGIIRDFCDALIEAKEYAISEVKESEKYFTDTNLSLVLLDLFYGGADSTQFVLQWIVLLMANNPQMQIKMRDEIESIIGDRIAVPEDRKSCHYVNAFIAEVQRLVGLSSIGIPHKALCDFRFGNYFIAKDSIVFSNLRAISYDTKYWKDPHVFNPNRFLTANNEFITNSPGFVPFGIGKRICLGEKLAMADLFLITVRLLKSLTGYTLVLPGGEGAADVQPNPDNILINTAKPYEVMIQKIKF